MVCCSPPIGVKLQKKLYGLLFYVDFILVFLSSLCHFLYPKDFCWLNPSSCCLQALGLALDQDPIPRPTTVNGTTHGSTRTNGSFGETTEASGGHIISGAEVKAFSAAAFSVVHEVDITTTITKTGKTSGSTLSSNRSSTTPTAPRGAVHGLPRSSRAARSPAAIPAALTGHPQGDRHSRTTLPPPTLGLPNTLAKI